MHNGSCKTSKEIDDDDKKKKKQQQNAEGADEKSREEKEKEQIAEAFKGLDLSDAKLSRKVDDLYKVINNGLNPRQREEVISETAKLVSSGKLGKDDVDTYLQFLDKVVVPQNVQYAQTFAVSGVWRGALPSAGLAAGADGPLPFGDVVALGILGGAGLTSAYNNREAIGSSLSEVWSNLFSKTGDGPTSVDDLSDEELEALGDSIGRHGYTRHRDQAEALGLTEEDMRRLARDLIGGRVGARLDEEPWPDGSVGFHERETGFGVLANPNHTDGGTIFIPDHAVGQDTREAFEDKLDDWWDEREGRGW